VNGFPGTLWLTQQKRVDRDYALFGEASYDFTPKLTLTAGGRLFRYDNSLVGFFGFGRDPNGPPFNAAGSSRTGVAACYLANGMTVRQAFTAGVSSPLLAPVVPGSPCTNLGVFENGTVVPKHAKGNGFIHRLNLQWKPQTGLMFYGTWSRGFRPGGINRRADIGAYNPDFLTNFELGWKTSFGPWRWNGAVYHDTWQKFQFAFLGANSFTEIHNGKDARVNGIESDVSYLRGGLSLTAAASYTDAKTKGNICNVFGDTSADCTGVKGDFISAPTGTRLPVTPKFKGSTTARYTWPAWADVKAHVQGTVSYQGSAPSSLRTLVQLVGTSEFINPNDPTAQGRLHASTLVDLFAGLDWPKWSLEVFGTNVFDKRNELSRFTACGSCTRALVVPGRPRTLGIRAGVKF
jgi:outer membrane receptor protein involved in Fe transport